MMFWSEALKEMDRLKIEALTGGHILSCQEDCTGFGLRAGELI
jgi:hypothetical protein